VNLKKEENLKIKTTNKMFKNIFKFNKKAKKDHDINMYCMKCGIHITKDNIKDECSHIYGGKDNIGKYEEYREKYVKNMMTREQLDTILKTSNLK